MYKRSCYGARRCIRCSGLHRIFPVHATAYRHPTSFHLLRQTERHDVILDGLGCSGRRCTPTRLCGRTRRKQSVLENGFCLPSPRLLLRCNQILPHRETEDWALETSCRTDGRLHGLLLCRQHLTFRTPEDFLLPVIVQVHIPVFVFAGASTFLSSRSPTPSAGLYHGRKPCRYERTPLRSQPTTPGYTTTSCLYACLWLDIFRKVSRTHLEQLRQIWAKRFKRHWLSYLPLCSPILRASSLPDSRTPGKGAQSCRLEG